MYDLVIAGYVITFEKSFTHATERPKYPDASRCASRPPEDCGGIWGYANLLEI